MEAKIVGEANMFPSLRHESLRVGEENVLAVKEQLRKDGIRLAGEVVGVVLAGRWNLTQQVES